MKKLRNMPLVKRMTLIYFAGPLLLFGLFCVFMIWFVTREMNRELQMSIDSDLERTVGAIDDTIGTLSMIAEQMAYGYVSTNLAEMLAETNPYEKSRLVGSISDEINVMSFTNPGIRLMGYLDTNRKKFLFVTNGAADARRLPEEKTLLNRYDFSFQGPHISRARNYNDLVLSVSKKVPSAEGISAYAELVIDLKPMNSFLQGSEFVIIGADGGTVYSGIPGIGEADFCGRKNGRAGAYFFSETEGADGCRVILLVPRGEFYRMFRKVMPASLLAVILLSSVFSAMVYLLIRNIVKPLHIFEDEIWKIQQGDLETRTYQKTNIPEYDHLMDEMMITKQRVSELLEERETAQRKQAKSRVDQLLYKINPHFLMNSLDTIHWLALAGNTKEIDKVARALNRLLYYNLKVDRNTVRLSEELEAVEQYVILQKSRFSFRYEVRISDEKAARAQVPRFILQPLVENAIYHGLHENGLLVIQAEAGERLDIYVRDDGAGMEPERLEELKDGAGHGKSGDRMGIGMSYVVQVLRERFGREAVFQVTSRLSEGTQVHMSMPFVE